MAARCPSTRSARSRASFRTPISPIGRRIPASAPSAPISSSPAAPFSRPSAGSGRSAGCGSPIAACARVSFSISSPRAEEQRRVAKGGTRSSGPGKDGIAGRGASRQKVVRVKTAKRRSAASTQWLARQLNDPYVGEAKRQGYRSRAAFKLLQLDDRFHLLRPGRLVVDLGCAPGGWTQVAVERVKPGGGQGV